MSVCSLPLRHLNKHTVLKRGINNQSMVKHNNRNDPGIYLTTAQENFSLDVSNVDFVFMGIVHVFYT